MASNVASTAPGGKREATTGSRFASASCSARRRAMLSDCARYAAGTSLSRRAICSGGTYVAPASTCPVGSRMAVVGHPPWL